VTGNELLRAGLIGVVGSMHPVHHRNQPAERDRLARRMLKYFVNRTEGHF